MQPPEGPPICTALNWLAVADAASDVEDDLAQCAAHGDLHQTAADDLAGEGEHLGALAVLGAHGGKGRAAVVDDPRHVGKGLHVVDVGGLAPDSRDWAGKGGLSRGMPRLPSMDAMRAVSSPQTKAPAPALMRTLQ